MTIYEELCKTAKLSKLEDLAAMPPISDEQAHIQWLARAVSSVTKEEFDELSPQAQQWFDTAADSLNSEGGTATPPPGFGDPPAKPKLVLSRPSRSAAPTPPPAAAPAPPVQAAPPAPAPKPPPPVQAAPVAPPAKPKLTQRPFPAQKPPPAAVPVQAAPAPPPEPEPEPEGHALILEHPEPSEPRRGETVSPPAQAASNGAKQQRRKRTAAPMPKIAGQSMTQRIRQYVLEDETLTVEDIIDRLQSETNQQLSNERRTTVATLRYDILRTLTMAKQAGWQPPTHH